MSTKIEWANESWNPITGCSQISEGCANCYARRMSNRLAGRYGYPEKPNQFKPTFHPDRLGKPLKWKKPRRIFICSMGDLFHHGVKTSWLNQVFGIITSSWEMAQEHKFMILTKRPGWMKKYIEEHRHYESAVCYYYEKSNIWLGITAENQEQADKRIPILLTIPAAVRFISIEPMLSCINLKSISKPNQGAVNANVLDEHGYYQGLKWVICGAETGSGKRPMDLDWARSLRNQCFDTGVPFFFKKDSLGNHTLDGQIWEQLPKNG